MPSYAHTVGDPTELVSTLDTQIQAVKNELDQTFDKPMNACLSDLESKDAIARARDPQALLQHRLTAAKTLVSASYVYLDAVWMYLKAKGVDPTTHPVHEKLERVQAYFAKLKEATENKDVPTQRIDMEAAGRMIKAVVPEGTHTRFDETTEPHKPSSSSSQKHDKETNTTASEPPTKKKKKDKKKKKTK